MDRFRNRSSTVLKNAEKNKDSLFQGTFQQLS